MVINSIDFGPRCRWVTRCLHLGNLGWWLRRLHSRDDLVCSGKVLTMPSRWCWFSTQFVVKQLFKCSHVVSTCFAWKELLNANFTNQIWARSVPVLLVLQDLFGPKGKLTSVKNVMESHTQIQPPFCRMRKQNYYVFARQTNLKWIACPNSQWIAFLVRIISNLGIYTYIILWTAFRQI